MYTCCVWDQRRRWPTRSVNNLNTDAHNQTVFKNNEHDKSAAQAAEERMHGEFQRGDGLHTYTTSGATASKEQCRPTDIKGLKDGRADNWAGIIGNGPRVSVNCQSGDLEVMVQPPPDVRRAPRSAPRPRPDPQTPVAMLRQLLISPIPTVQTGSRPHSIEITTTSLWPRNSVYRASFLGLPTDVRASRKDYSWWYEQLNDVHKKFWDNLSTLIHNEVPVLTQHDVSEICLLTTLTCQADLIVHVYI